MQALKIGTRESALAVWQAKQVQTLLTQYTLEPKLVFISSEGDIDLKTPLYEMGVQGIFTKTLDAALLNNSIDIAVHSMKDVPTQLPEGLVQAAVLPRGSYKDLLVFKGDAAEIRKHLGLVNGDPISIGWAMGNNNTKTRDRASTVGNNKWEIGNGKLEMENCSPFTIATSSIRRKAQWLHRYPHDAIENLRGNINTRLQKLDESNWNAAIFAAAGLERIGLRPPNSIELNWMLPAPAQGAIMVVCRCDDESTFNICQSFNHRLTELCTKIERDFLRSLSGGCSTPISALAEITGDKISFNGSICSADGVQRIDIKKDEVITDTDLGTRAAEELLAQPAVKAIVHEIKNAKK